MIKFNLRPRKSVLIKNEELLFAMDILTVYDFMLDSRILRREPNSSMMWRWCTVQEKNRVLLIVPVPHADEDTGKVILFDHSGQPFYFTEEEALKVMVKFTYCIINYILEQCQKPVAHPLFGPAIEHLRIKYGNGETTQALAHTIDQFDEGEEFDFYLRMNAVLD